MYKFPVIFLTFANDRLHPDRFLKALEPEKDGIKSILIDYIQKGWGQFFDAATSAPENLIPHLNKFQNQIIIFHFSGHANSTALTLEGQSESNIYINRANLADILASEKKLKLVFLNACATANHVQLLLDAGIPAIIATDREIEDEAAKKFSIAFYGSLVAGSTLKNAFRRGQTVMYPNDSAERVYRSIGLTENFGNDFPWGLYIAKNEVLEWKLTDEIQDIPNIPHELNLIPQPPSNFIGRDIEIEEIRQHLSVSEQPILISGIGGIGKTSLMRKYIYRYKSAYHHLAWISVLPETAMEPSARNHVREAIINDKLLHGSLNLPFNIDLPEEERLNLLLQALRNLPGKNLLVIDNVTAQIEKIYQLLPQNPNWHVLVTSRENLSVFAEYQLDSLPRDEAIEMFLKYFPRGAKELKMVDNLLEHIGFHTLTIELLAKTCSNSLRLSVGKIMEKLLASELNHQSLQKEVWTEHSERQVQVFAYLLEAFVLSNLTKEQKRLLTQFSILPSIEIEGYLLLMLFQVSIEDEGSFEDNLLHLVRKGWLIHNPKTTTFRCHLLIQETIRYQLNPTVESCKAIIEGTIALLSLDQTKDNPVEKFQYLVFGEQILAHVNHKSPRISQIKSRLGILYLSFGKHYHALNLLEESLDADLQHFGPLHPRIIVTQTNLAMVYKALGQFDKARVQFELALIAAEEHYGPNHPNTAKSQSNLASFYQDIGEYEQAEKLLIQALSINENFFGKDSLSVAVNQSNLGMVYKALERYEDARDLLQLALEIGEKCLGTDHPIVAVRQSNLATVYGNLKEFAKARELLEKALVIDIKYYGIDHPKTARRQANLANIFTDLGMFDMAKDLLDKSLLINQNHFGEIHPTIAISYNNLAWVYREQCFWTKAKELYEKAYLIAKIAFGETHPHTVIYKEASNLMDQYLNNAEPSF